MSTHLHAHSQVQIIYYNQSTYLHIFGLWRKTAYVNRPTDSNLSSGSNQGSWSNEWQHYPLCLCAAPRHSSGSVEKTKFGLNWLNKISLLNSDIKNRDCSRKCRAFEHFAYTVHLVLSTKNFYFKNLLKSFYSFEI